MYKNYHKTPVQLN